MDNITELIEVPGTNTVKLHKIPVWTTKDGRQIPVDQMSPSHMENTKEMLLRRRAARRKKFKELRAWDCQMHERLTRDMRLTLYWIKVFKVALKYYGPVIPESSIYDWS